MRKLMSIAVLAIVLSSSCTIETQQQKSDSGVTKATVKVQTDQKGLTIEQKNYEERVKRDNDFGSVKHLYIISSYTGDVMQYSTVKGKVTSGGKRLSPATVNSQVNSSISGFNYNKVNIGDKTFSTDELMDENGTYGQSMNYIYWFDAQDNYHQYFPSGGTYLHISDKPLKVKKNNMTFEVL